MRAMNDPAEIMKVISMSYSLTIADRLKLVSSYSRHRAISRHMPYLVTLFSSTTNDKLCS